MLKSWIVEIRRGLYDGKKCLLDESFEKTNNVPNLKTTLFPHQQTVVKAMCDIERHRTFIKDTSCTKINACILSEAVGSGKTIDILSVILIQKIPSIKPDINPLHMTNSCRQSSSIVRIKYSKILKPTIIFVGSNVLNQWFNAIKEFTSLKVFIVKNVHHLQTLIDYMHNRLINQYDIVLVKNGKVTRAVKFPANIVVENKNKNHTTYHIINIIENMRIYCWARVVLDDYDVCIIPRTYGGVNGLFTWYVSSTTKYRSRFSVDNGIKTTADMILVKNRNNPFRNRTFNICNTKQFVDDTSRLPSINFYKYEFENPNDQYVGLIQLFGSDEASEISEMLNSDSINTASERLGIKTTNVSSIFQHMLGTQYTNYLQSTDLIKFINYEKSCEDTRLDMKFNEIPDDTYNQSHIKIKRHVEYKYPGVKALLDKVHIDYTLIKNTSGAAIERVKSNIRDGECPICVTDLDDCDEDVFILKCCGVAICGSCCIGTIIAKRTRVCIKCRSNVNLRTDLIYLSQEFDLSKIIDDDMGYNQTGEIKEDTKTEEKASARVKMSAMMDIVNGIKPIEQQPIDVNVGNLMKGTCVLPPADITKVLIFANYDEGLNKITKMLEEKKILHWRLMGTANCIDNMVKKYKDSTTSCALVVNSIKYCAGLNLQCSSDLIFMHKIHNPNIETQVIGRGQRLGRTSPLNVHYMLYNNEYINMNRLNQVRHV